MGVFVTGRQVALEIPMPGWWLTGASVDLDFDSGRYYDSSTANPRAATDFLSCTRASIGYARTAEGTLTQFSSNALRLTSAGLLVEDARTNIILQSTALNNASWTNYQCTLTSGFSAPDGTTTGYSYVENTVNDSHQLSQAANITSGTARPFTVSVYLKQLSGNRLIRLSHMDQSANGYLFEINASWVVTVTATGSGASNPSYTLTPMANGWYLFTATVTCLTTSTNQRVQLNLENAVENSVYTGDGSSGWYVWGPQIEEAAFASSYIPTTSTSATRAADSIAISGAAQTIIAAATGSIVAQIGTQGGIGFAANVVDSNGTNVLGFNASNNGLASLVATLATGNTANRSAGDDKLGLAWSGAGRSIVLNGGTVATDASAQTPSSTQKLGSANATSNFIYAYVERLTLWNSKLADATLQGFTR